MFLMVLWRVWVGFVIIKFLMLFWLLVILLVIVFIEKGDGGKVIFFFLRFSVDILLLIFWRSLGGIFFSERLVFFKVLVNFFWISCSFL